MRSTLICPTKAKISNVTSTVEIKRHPNPIQFEIWGVTRAGLFYLRYTRSSPRRVDSVKRNHIHQTTKKRKEKMEKSRYIVMLIKGLETPMSYGGWMDYGMGNLMEYEMISDIPLQIWDCSFKWVWDKQKSKLPNSWDNHCHQQNMNQRCNVQQSNNVLHSHIITQRLKLF